MQTPVVLFPVSIEELQHLIKITVEEAMRVAAAPSSAQVWPDVLTKKEAMKLLGDISVPTFDSLVKSEKLLLTCFTNQNIILLRLPLLR